jgi:hypothetical protein
MQCPLCGGPLHLEDELVFACERGHQMDADQMRVAASARVTTALWMAIEALETEAAALRTMVSAGAAGGDRSALADQAEADARLLRGVTKAHLPPGQATGGSDGGD